MSEALARRFHETYERLAPQFGYETRNETRRFDPDSANGRLMIAVVEAVASEIIAAEREACAQVCEAGITGTDPKYAEACRTCAVPIRNRGAATGAGREGYD